MAHQYDVELSDGQSYTVTTEEHHEDHHENVFSNHLFGIIEKAAPLVLSAVIVRWIYRGKK
jgi:hypothetical protein